MKKPLSKKAAPPADPFIYQKVNTACLFALAIVAFTIILRFGKGMLMPLSFAVLIYIAISPLIRFLMRTLKMPKIASLGVSFIGLSGLIVLLVLFVSNSINTFIKGADIYKEQFAATIAWANRLLTEYGSNLNLNSIQSYVTELPVFSVLAGTGKWMFSFFTTTILIALMLLFLFVASGATKDSPHQESKMGKEIQNSISRYLIVKTLVSLVTGIVVWIILASFKVELAFIFGFLTFVLNYIPNFGSIIAVMLPIPVLLLQFQLSPKFWIIMGLAIAAQFTIGNLIEPRIIGQGIDLHPITVIACLIFWGMIWGVPGAFLAVPLTAAIKILLSQIEPTRPVAELLAGRINL